MQMVLLLDGGQGRGIGWLKSPIAPLWHLPITYAYAMRVSYCGFNPMIATTNGRNNARTKLILVQLFYE